METGILAGIDIGTSGVKAVLLNREGRLVSWASREYSIETPQPGWAEQNPQDWLDGAAACMREAVRAAGIAPRQVAGIGLAGQMHTLVCLDERGEPLRPAILWADQRSAPQVQALTNRIGRGRLAETAGNPLATGFMLASWAWLAENEPESAAKTRWLLLPKDYVRYRLTGEIAAEQSDASSTLLFDPHTLRWSDALLQEAGLESDQLPSLKPSHALGGALTSEFAAACGLAAGTPVVSGSSDVSAQALAQGILQPGTVSCTIGTGGQLFAPLAAPAHDPELRLHLFCHCIPDTWHHEAAILSAGLALRWLRDQVLRGTDYSSLADAAQDVDAAAEGLFFLPFLAGERTPYMDPNLSAAFFGMRLHHTAAHLTRAVMEGVIFALRQGLDLMEALGTPVERLVATGGAVRHPLWLQLQADIFNRTVYVMPADRDSAESRGAVTARGAALLAGIGTGLFASAQDAVGAAVGNPVPGVQPDPRRAERYHAAYREYIRWAEIAAAK